MYQSTYSSFPFFLVDERPTRPQERRRKQTGNDTTQVINKLLRQGTKFNTFVILSRGNTGVLTSRRLTNK